MRAPEFRLRTPSAGLLALPWDRPLSEWNVPDVPLRDIAVGPSRHLVKFVEADDLLWAVKDMPARIAAKEYEVLRRLEEMGLPAVRPAGLVLQPEFDTAILVTRYLEGSWQYRRLFMRLPPDQPKHRARLLDAMAGLLVELHRHGVFWGDCSLANTLFSRDGQILQAWLVDAETSEVHPTLSRGQRRHDLDIMVENVAMGMVDLAERLGRPEELQDTLIAEAEHIRDRYTALWDVLHAEPVFGFTDRYRVEGTVRRLNDLGFAVDEVSLQPVTDDPSQLRIHVAVGDRRYHAQRLQELTGLDVGEGQARILLGDLRAYQAQLCREAGHDVDESTAATAVGDRGGDAHRAPGARGAGPLGHRHSGVLRPTRSALATQREGRPRRRHQCRARRTEPRRHTHRLRREDGHRRSADSAVCRRGDRR